MEEYGPQALLENFDWSYFELEEYDQNIIYVGIIIFVTGLLPGIIEKKTITPPIIYFFIGIGIFLLPIDYRLGHLAENPWWPLRITEFGVIVSLTAVGLKLNDPFTVRNWRISRWLLIITMPLTIFLLAAMGYWFLGFIPATAMLFGAVIAPTDPVLAAEVQTPSPDKEDHSESKLALTTEAGLNDGLAFPFTNLAVAMMLAGTAPANWFQGWLAIDVFYKIIVGVGIGFFMGWLLGKALFSFPAIKTKISKISTGMLSLSLTLIPYGVAELAHSYGFLAVFVAACVFRSIEKTHHYLGLLHDFSEEVESLLVAILFVFLGYYMVNYFVVDFHWYMVPAALATIFIIRPLAGMVGLIPTKIPLRKKILVSFFGIRGIGSLYYIFYAFYMIDFPKEKELLALVILIIIFSVFVHGLLAKPAVRWALPNEKIKTIDKKEDN
jgi:NhaP-type Na+/H+ or K+/H+ antiporter